MSRASQRFRHCSPLVLLLALPWLHAGCEVTSPDSPESGTHATKLPSSAIDPEGLASRGNHGDFFPLELGNRWQYERMFGVIVVPDGEEPQPPMTVRASIETELTGTEILFGTSYVLMERRWDEGDRQGTNWYRYRQDRSGLFEADVSIVQPPASGLRVLSTAGESGAPESDAWDGMVRSTLVVELGRRGAHPCLRRALDEALARHAMVRDAVRAVGRTVESDPAKAGRPGGQLAQEITRLRYPLHPGATWTIRANPLVTATVEGAENLAIDAGRFMSWRIRIDWPGSFGPRDRVVVWFGRCGELQFAAHLEGIATDENGQPIGTVISDEREVVTEIELGGGGCR